MFNLYYVLSMIVSYVRARCGYTITLPITGECCVSKLRVCTIMSHKNKFFFIQHTAVSVPLYKSFLFLHCHVTVPLQINGFFFSTRWVHNHSSDKIYLLRLESFNCNFIVNRNSCQYTYHFRN